MRGIGGADVVCVTCCLVFGIVTSVQEEVERRDREWQEGMTSSSVLMFY